MAERRSIGDQLEQRAHAYFPGGADDWRAIPGATLLRPGSRLYGFTLRSATDAREVVVKVPRRAGACWAVKQRPRLLPLVTGPEEDLAEFRSLQLIAGHLGRLGDPRLRAVHPLDHLAAQRAFVMERVHDPTLQEVIRRHAIRGGRFVDRGTLDRPFVNTGAWLRAFQDLPEAAGTVVHRGRRDEVVELAAAYVEHLARHGADAGLLQRVLREFSRRAADCFPAVMPTALLHSDLAPRNVFVGPAGEVRVIDALVRWRAPIYEPLAYLLTAIQTSRPQVRTRGLAGRVSGLDEAGEHLLEGYFGHDHIPREAIETYRILLLLDRWADLVTTHAGGGGAAQRRRHAYLSRLTARALRRGA